MSARLRRRLVLLVTIVVGLPLLLVVAGLPLYVFPQTDVAGKTDVIFVIGPPTQERLDLAKQLIHEGFSDTLMVSTSYPELHTTCTQPQDFAVYCVEPDPFTTQGESQFLAAMADEHGWSSATVITFTPHVTRTRILVERCFTGELRVIAEPTPLSLNAWLSQYVYQTAAFAKVALSPGC